MKLFAHWVWRLWRECTFRLGNFNLGKTLMSGYWCNISEVISGGCFSIIQSDGGCKEWRRKQTAGVKRLMRKLQVGGKGLPRYYWRTAYINTHKHVLILMWPSHHIHTYWVAKHSLNYNKGPLSNQHNTFKHDIWEGGCSLRDVWGMWVWQQYFCYGNILCILTIHISFSFICNFYCSFWHCQNQMPKGNFARDAVVCKGRSHNLTGSQILISQRQSFSCRKWQVLEVRKWSKPKILHLCALSFVSCLWKHYNISTLVGTSL